METVLQPEVDIDEYVFVTHWEASGSINEVCRRSGLSRFDVLALASHLRCIGVNIKNLRELRQSA